VAGLLTAETVRSSSPCQYTVHVPSVRLPIFGGGNAFRKSVDYVTQFTPRESGRHYIGVSGLGPTQLYINNELILEQTGSTPDGFGFFFNIQEDIECVYSFIEATSYEIRIKSMPTAILPGFWFMQDWPGCALAYVLLLSVIQISSQRQSIWPRKQILQ
jgi:hypothetical protein